MGVKIAARVHVAAATPGLHHPIDMHYHHLTDDVIMGGMHRIEGGCITVGDKPGLGVELDPEKVERYRWTPELQAEGERLRQQLTEEHRVIPKDRWASDPHNYPYY
jgi:glucarate dehydratase